MNKKSSKNLNIFFTFSILVAIVASVMISNSISTLEIWAFRNLVNLLIFILVIFSGVVLTILVPLLGLYSFFSKKLGIKIKNFENICFALIISILLTSLFGDDILKITSIASSSLQNFLTFVGTYVGLFLLIIIYFLVFNWVISSTKKPKLKIAKKSNFSRISRIIKKAKKIFRERWPQVKEGIKVTAWLAAIITAGFVIYTTIEIRESILKTQPDLRVAGIYPFLWGTGAGHSEIGEDGCALYYHNENEIDDFSIEVKIANIGSGVAYGLDVKLSLPGLRYHKMEFEENEGVRKYIDRELIEKIYFWRDNFYFKGITISPLGDEETIELQIPFEAIGSIDNLPSSCVIMIKGIDKTILLSKTVSFDYVQY